MRSSRQLSHIPLCDSHTAAFRPNFIPIEQKRRQAIREGFDRLTELVPGLEGQGRSEGLVLKKTVDYMREKIEERRVIVAGIEAKGGEVDEELKR